MTAPKATPLAAAIARRDWERASLYVLVAMARALRQAPASTLDDLVAVLVDARDGDDARKA